MSFMKQVHEGAFELYRAMGKHLWLHGWLITGVDHDWLTEEAAAILKEHDEKRRKEPLDFESHAARLAMGMVPRPCNDEYEPSTPECGHYLVLRNPKYSQGWWDRVLQPEAIIAEHSSHYRMHEERGWPPRMLEWLKDGFPSAQYDGSTLDQELVGEGKEIGPFDLTGEDKQ